MFGKFCLVQTIVKSYTVCVKYGQKNVERSLKMHDCETGCMDVGMNVCIYGWMDAWMQLKRPFIGCTLCIYLEISNNL